MGGSNRGCDSAPGERVSILALYAVLTGCVDYEVKGGHDTGRLGGDPDETECDFDSHGCYKVELGVDSAALSGVCAPYHEVSPGDMGSDRERLEFHTLHAVAVIGLGVDEPGGPIYVAFDQDKESSTNSWPYASDTYRSDPLYAEPFGSYCWKARAESGELGNLESCITDDVDESCSLDYVVVEIEDEEAAEAGECSKYTLGGSLYVCMEGKSPLEMWATVPNSQGVDLDAQCVPGSGEFALVPMNTVNLDGDRYATSLLRPIMVSGDGVLTATARLLSVRVDSSPGGSVKMQRGHRENWRVGVDDKLSAPHEGVVVVGPRAVSLTDGDVLGSTYFVLEEFPIDREPLVRMRLEWECRPATLSQLAAETQAPAGTSYHASLRDLGCIGGWDQRLSLAVEGSGSGRSLLVAVYGMPDLQVRSRLTSVGGVDRFDASRGGIRVSGAVLPGGSGASLIVRLDSVTYKGLTLCSPGTYRLTRE